ncbi:hypothetical protein ABVK25_003011 [Lepraria finkii]|uniref:Uncharacterized protein n=1 Tax=Lepraria finkii TaxID=1340010 RepID=A0ABR4BFK6_9LECA
MAKAIGALDIFGTVGTGFGMFMRLLSIVSFIENQVPNNLHPGEHSSIRVQVALDGPAYDGMAQTPLDLAFNENRGWIGHSDWDDDNKIRSGAFRDFIVMQEEGKSQQATYLLAESDGICIANIAQTWADGTHRGWLGDFGAFYGMNWLPSNIIVGENSHKPNST